LLVVRAVLAGNYEGKRAARDMTYIRRKADELGMKLVPAA
jgi:hypothetical protein